MKNTTILAAVPIVLLGRNSERNPLRHVERIVEKKSKYGNPLQLESKIAHVLAPPSRAAEIIGVCSLNPQQIKATDSTPNERHHCGSRSSPLDALITDSGSLFSCSSGNLGMMTLLSCPNARKAMHRSPESLAKKGSSAENGKNAQV